MAQSQGGFSLPPNPSPTATPRAQGPVDDSGVVPVGPRVIATTPAPTPSASASPAPAPTAATPAPRPRPTASPSPVVPRTAATPERRVAPPPPVVEPLPQAPAPLPLEPGSSPTVPLPAATATPPAQAGPTAAAEDGDGAAGGYVWILALIAGLAALAGAAYAWRRRAPAAPAQIEAPRPIAETGTAAIASDLTELRVELEAIRVTRSMRNATLAYRLTLTNRGTRAIRNLAIGGDLTSAHGGSPLTDQLADPAVELPPLHVVDHLGAGQRKALTGEMRLPLEAVRLIRQGTVPIYVPLARIRASDGAAEPRAFTFVVGKQPQPGGGRLQPFRLDTPPQGFSDVGARALT